MQISHSTDIEKEYPWVPLGFPSRSLPDPLPIPARYMAAFLRSVTLKNVVEIEYPLEIKGKECWFSARINYRSGETAIFNAFDITLKT